MRFCLFCVCWCLLLAAKGLAAQIPLAASPTQEQAVLLRAADGIELFGHVLHDQLPGSAEESDDEQSVSNATARPLRAEAAKSLRPIESHVLVLRTSVGNDDPPESPAYS